MERKKIVTLFVENENGKLLLQKRSKQKGGKYGFISGHVQEGETNSQGMIRETKEEIGIDICEKDMKRFYETKQNQKTYNFYYIKNGFDIRELEIQKEEVENVKWCSKEEIRTMIDKNQLYKNHIDAFAVVMNYLNKNNK